MDLKYDLILALLSLLLLWVGILHVKNQRKIKSLKAEFYRANRDFLHMAKMEDASSLREQETMKLLQESMAMNRSIHAALEEENKRLTQKINDMNQLHYN